jgi:inorganic triphosphatase YgiF
MTKETELKLRLHPEDIPALVSRLNADAVPQTHSTLKNWYLDTSDAALSTHRAALRIRQKGDGYEQTLKTRGKSVAGMQVRGEWNWPLTSPQADLSLLASAEVAEHWPAAIATDQLGEVFTTHFERQSWIYSAHGGEAEIVIDQGRIEAAGRSLPLCEVELELRSGDAACLWAMAAELSQSAALWLSDISKAERGYRLAGLSNAWQVRPAIKGDADVSEVLPELLHYELLSMKRMLEASLWDGEPCAQDAAEHAQALKTLPNLAGKVIKRRQTRELRTALDALIAPLQALALAEQLQGYLQAADDAGMVGAELKVLRTQAETLRKSLRSDKSLAQAVLAAASALFGLQEFSHGKESALHWLRHLLAERAGLMEEIKRHRPQEAEQWRGRMPAITQLRQCADYAQDLPAAARGLGVQGGGIAAGSVRVLSDMLGAGLVLQRPWMLAADQALRSPDEYGEWALEHLKSLGHQL